MTPGRRLLLSLACSTLIYSGMASALGMGDITLHSALNQPLNAEIELVDVGDLSPEDIRVVLASSSDFANVGVERLEFLQDLSFTPVLDGNRSRIRVASSKPVREPYLNFLVEITRAQSRMLREYTVLLDPMPEMAEGASSVAVSVPQAAAAPMRTEPPRFVPPAELPQATQDMRHRVADGDSLWTIAGAYAPGVAQSQFMRDVQALNPDAFTNGDPARLKAGADLLLPDTADVNAVAASAVPVPETQIASANPQMQAAASVEPVQLDEQFESLRVQLFDELATSREENQQLRQMLVQMQQQLETVTAQLSEQGRGQVVAPPPAAPVVVADEPVIQPVAESSAQVAVADEPPPSFRWQDWTLPGAGVLVALLLAGLWFSRRHPAAPVQERQYVAASPQSPVPPMALGAVTGEMPRQPAHASVSETDVLEAADIYITYGRRDEAIDVLQRGIERSPEQLDLRLRHLGLLAESGIVEDYSVAAEGYLDAGGSQAQLDQLLALHPALASALPPPEPPLEPPMEPLYEPLMEPPLDVGDPDVSFVLNEAAEMEPPGGGAAYGYEAPRPVTDLDQAFSTDSQAWLDDFDEVLPLDGMPAPHSDDEDDFGSMSLAEDMRQLEPNPEHLIRLDQAMACIEQGDIETACVILESLATEGDEWQRRQVNELLAKIA